MAGNELKLRVLLEAVDRATAPFKRIVGGSSAVAKALRATQTQLRSLEEQQNRVGGFRRLEAQLSQTSQKLVSAQRELRRLASEVNAAEAPNKKLMSALKRQADAVGKLREMQERQRASLNASRQALAATGIDTARLAVHERQLRDNIAKANRAMDDQRARLEKLAVAQQRARQLHSGGMIAAMHGAGMAVGGGAVLNQAAAHMQPAVDFEARMRDIAITGGFTRPQEAALGAKVMADAKRWGQFTQVISDGLSVLVANGISSSEQLAYYSELLAKSSVATGAEMQDLGNLVVTLQQNLGIAQEGIGGALDSLAYAGKQGSFELRDMAKWMPQLTPMMAGLGVSGRAAVDELGAALQVARLGAGSSDEAANNLRNYLSKLTSPDTIKDFDRAGIDLKGRLLELQAQGISPLQGSLQLITEYMGKKGPEAMRKLREAAALKDDAERQAALEKLAAAYALGNLFQDAQAMAFVRPALANTDKMASVRHGASQASGVIDQDWIARMDTVQKQIDQFNIRLQDLKLKAGAQLMPALNRLAESAGRLLDRFSAFSQQHPVIASGVLKVVIAVAALVTALGGLLTVGGMATMFVGNMVKVIALLGGGQGFTAIGKLAGLLGSLAGRVLPLLASAFRMVGAAITANPIGILLMLIAGLVYVIYRNWDFFGPWFQKLWDGIVAVASWAWGWIKRLFAFTPLGMIIANWGRIKDYLAQLWAGIKQYVAGAWTAITGIFSGDGAKIRAGLEQMWQAINGILGGWPQKLMQAGIEMINGLVQGIRAKLGAVKEALSSIGSGAVGALKSLLGIRSPSRVFAQLGVYTMQGFAGGIARGQTAPLARIDAFGTRLRQAGAGLALAAAGAPAVAIDSRPPVTAPAAIGGAAGGGISVGAIHIHAAPGMDERALAQEVRRQLELLERERAARTRSRLGDYGD